MAAKLLDRFSLGKVKTPIGTALIATDQDGNLRALDWEDYEARFRRLWTRHNGEAKLAPGTNRDIAAKIAAYFAGDLKTLDAIPCKTGGTDFQRAVWGALRKIPCGTTLSYGALAVKLAVPKAVRAVGLANGANPIGVVVPCHRVIGTNGSLTGYGGGLSRKKWLLDHEGFRSA